MYHLLYRVHYQADNPLSGESNIIISVDYVFYVVDYGGLWKANSNNKWCGETISQYITLQNHSKHAPTGT